VKMKSAWVVTWEWSHRDAAVDRKVAALLNYRKTGHFVRDVVEYLYMNRGYNAAEMAQCAKDPSSNPYSARFADVKGVPFIDRIYCGHNPYLYARRVSNVRPAQGHDDGAIEWDERPFPKAPGL